MTSPAAEPDGDADGLVVALGSVAPPPEAFEVTQGPTPSRAAIDDPGRDGATSMPPVPEPVERVRAVRTAGARGEAAWHNDQVLSAEP
jgi:hypothetical protein